MFADPLTFTINSVAKDLIRINQDGYSSEYLLRGATDEFRARIRHSQYTNSSGVVVHRHNVELTQTIYAVAPATVNTVRKSYLVFEATEKDSVTSAQQFTKGFADFFDSTNVTKLLNWES